MNTKAITTLLLSALILPLCAVSADEYNWICCVGNDAMGFSVTADWLYLRPCTSDLPRKRTVLKGADDVTRDKLKSIDPDLASGFRLGVGYRQTVCCDWDVALDWLHYSTTYSEKIFDIRSDPIRGFTGRAKNRVDLNDVQLGLGYRYCIGECFSVRPKAALRTLSICRKVKIVNVFNDVTSGARSSSSEADFKGYGPQFGMNSQWNFDCGLGIYGDFDFALLYGDDDAKTTSIDTDQEGIDEVFIDKDSFKCSVPVVSCSVGVFYRADACRFPYIARLGWEHHHFLDLRTPNESLGVDFSLQGLRLGLEVGF